MGATVTVFDRNIDRMRDLDVAFGGRADTLFASTLAIEEMLPEARKLAEYCDIFCEPRVFPVNDARRILTAANALACMIRGVDPIDRADLHDVATLLRDTWRVLRPLEEHVPQRIADSQVVRLRPALTVVRGGRI